MGKSYREPKLVLFTGGVRSGCGTAMSAMGPFYCPVDQKLYVDLSFYRQMKTQFGASGDFAQAYVIAHEVGHHVQTLFGISEKVQRAKSRMSQRQGNAVQVRMELQADCFAGVWARLTQRAKKFLEAGDIEEGLNAASAIGDDNIQRKTQGHVVPDAFTHGSSKQRVRWFKRGLDSGDIHKCDTFNASSL
jgi:predicted metalloprotease